MKVGRISTALLGALVGIILVGNTGVFATHQPADKVAAAASNVRDVVFIANAETKPLLSETFRTARPTDLILNVSAECSIINDVTTVGNDNESSRGQLEFFLTISTAGGPTRIIGVEEAGPPANQPGMPRDDGGVIFCNRTFVRQTNLGADDATDTVRTFIETRQANAFDWVALNAGSGIHTVTLTARYTAANTAGSSSTGAVGRRTLVIEPVKAKNDEQVTDVVVD